MEYHVILIIPHATKLGGGGGILDSPCLSVCLSVNLSCPPCSIYSSGWILSIFGTNVQWHKRVCPMWWPLTLTYIFKVIRPWLKKSCPLCSVYSSGWILFIFGTHNHHYKRVCRVLGLSESGNLNFWQIFEFFPPWPRIFFLQFSMDSFHIWHKWSLVLEGVLHVMTFDLDLYLQGHLALALKIVPLCSIYSSWWILSISGTNDH